MSFINDIKQRAKEQIKTIVLPESNDIRVLKAVDTIVKEKFANIILTTNQEDYDFIEKRFKVQNLKKINGFGIICKNSTKKLSKQEKNMISTFLNNKMK